MATVDSRSTRAAELLGLVAFALSLMLLVESEGVLRVVQAKGRKRVVACVLRSGVLALLLADFFLEALDVAAAEVTAVAPAGVGLAG